MNQSFHSCIRLRSLCVQGMQLRLRRVQRMRVSAEHDEHACQHA